MIYKYNDKFVFYRVVDINRVESKLMAEHIENAKRIILDNFEAYTYG
jgi:hypothetical protein